MKSIMEEASTISKAVENAWNRAGQPQEFTIKVLEFPKTSFFGLKTAKSAKVALIFSESSVKAKEQPQRQIRPLGNRQSSSGQRSSEQPERSQQLQRRPLPSREQRTEQSHTERSADNRQDGRPEQRRPHHSQQRSGQGQQRQPYRSESSSSEEPRREEPRRYDARPQERENWAQEMVDTAHDWVKETLVLMGKPEIKVTPHVSQNYLKLYLDQSVMPDARQEETQLKSWGSLAMEAVREKAHKPLRSLRIILESKR